GIARELETMTSMAAPAALPDAEWSECLLPAGPVPREMAREVRRAVGALPGWVPRLAPSPWIVRAFRDTIQRPAAYLPRTFFDLGAVVVSQDNSCRYCYGAQRAVMKVLGYRDEYLDRLVRDFHVVDLPPGEPPPQPNDGPLAALVTALGDSPAASVVRRMIEGAWNSPVLPRRTRALLLAVVARALGCAYSEGEARRLLAAEGLEGSHVDEILTHLGSAQLDRREARLVPFARETVRYQPAAIQRRVRETCDAMSREETLGTIGTVALANALCRTSVVLDA